MSGLSVRAWILATLCKCVSLGFFVERKREREVKRGWRSETSTIGNNRIERFTMRHAKAYSRHTKLFDRAYSLTVSCKSLVTGLRREASSSASLHPPSCFFFLFLWLPFFMNSRLRRSEDHRKAPTVEASKREFLINGRVNPSLRIVLISRGGTVTVVVNIRRGTAPFPARFFTSSVVSSNPMLTTIQTTMDRIIHNWYIDLCMQRTS